MKITIVGASAGVGLETTKCAIARNHIVTTLSRSNIALADSKNLVQVHGSATDKKKLKKAIIDADAVIVTLGTGASTKATTLYSDFAKVLVDIQQETQQKIPFIILTGFGAGESADYNSFFLKLIFKFILKKVYDDKTKMEEIIANANLNWEIVRPGALKDKPFTGKYRVESKLFKGIDIGGINRADVADFLVKQAEHPTKFGQYYSLSNK